MLGVSLQEDELLLLLLETCLEVAGFKTGDKIGILEASLSFIVTYVGSSLVLELRGVPEQMKLSSQPFFSKTFCFSTTGVPGGDDVRLSSSSKATLSTTSGLVTEL